MASEGGNHKGKNNFPPSIYSLGLDKLLDSLQKNETEPQSPNYVVHRDRIVKFAEKLSSDFKALKNSIKEKDKEIEKLSSTTQENKSKDHKFQEEVKTSRREISRLQSKIQRIEFDAEKVNKHNTELQEENNNITIKMHWAQNRLKTELESIVTCKTELESTQKKFKQVSEEKEQIHCEFRSIILQYENGGEGGLGGSSAEIGGVSLQREVIEGLRMELEGCERELAERKESIDELKGKITSLEDEKTHLIKQVEKGEKWKHKCEQLKSDLEHLKTQISTQKEEIRTAKETSSELRSKNKSLTDVNQMQHKKLAQQETKLEKVNNKLENLTNEHSQMKTELSSVKNELSVSEVTNDELKGKAGNSQKEIENLLAKCHEFNEISLRLREKTEKEKSLEISLERNQVELEDTRNKLSISQEREIELTNSVNKLKENLRNLEQENSTLVQMKAQLEIELNSFRIESEKLNLTNSVLKDKCEKQEIDFKLELDRTNQILSEKEVSYKEMQLKLFEQRNENKIIEKKQNKVMKDISKLVKAQADKLGAMERTREEPPLSPNSKERSQSFPSLTSEIENKEENISVLFETIDNFAIKIERLQLELNQKKDKILFQEDHLKQLTKELQKKSRIMQNIVDKSELEETHSLKSPPYIMNFFAPQDGLLSNEIKIQQQILVEDTLMRNIALQASLEFITGQVEKLESENNKLKKDTETRN